MKKGLKIKETNKENERRLVAFNHAPSSSVCIVSNARWTVNNELERIWKEAMMI
jgi:hypothetical protein